MADVFLSYAAEDRPLAAALGRALQAAGFSVWWDRDIHAGADFAQLIGRELAAARVVVVLWSSASVVSEWVRDEATQARDEGKLLPVQLDATRPPLGFRQRQALDFAAWSGAPSDPVVGQLVDAIRVMTATQATATVVPAPGTTPAPTGTAPSARRRWPLLAGGAVLALVAVAAWRWSSEPPPVTPGSVAVIPFHSLGRETDELAGSLTVAVTNKLTEKAIPILPAPRAEFQLGGSVGRADGEPYIDLSLQNAAGRPLWSRRLLRKEQTVAVFQEYASRRATWALSCALYKRGRASAPLTDDLFARVVSMCDQFMAEERGEYFAAAQEFLRLAPNLSTAHSELATAARNLISEAQSDARRQELAAVCRAEAEVALQLDARDPWAHFVLGGNACGPADPKAQETHLRRGMEAGAEFSPAWPSMISRLRALGRVREAADLAREGSARFPESDFMPEVYGLLLASEGESLESRRWFDRARAMNPDYRGDVEVAAAAFYGDPQPVANQIDALVADGRLDPVDARCWQDFIKAKLRSPPNAADALAGCTRQDPAHTAVRIRMLASLGDLEAAYALAQRLPDRSWREVGAHLFMPEMKSFRHDARFWPLAARLGLVEIYLQTGEWPDFCSDPDLPYACQAQATAAVAAAGPAS